MWIKKILKKILLFTFVTSIILSFGFLSMVGMLTIFPYLVLGAAAFILSGLVEGEVFKQNIKSALKKLFSLKFAKDRLILAALDISDQQMKENLQASDIGTEWKKWEEWKEYENLKKEVDALKVKKQNLPSALQSGYKKHYKECKNRLKTAEDKLLKAVANSENLEIQKIVKSASKKRFVEYLFLFFNLLTGVLFTLVTLQALHTALAFFSLTIFLTMPAIIPLIAIPLLAVSAGIGYCLLMYNNISSMIEDNWLQKWKKQFKEIYSLKDEENKISYVFKVIAVTLLLTITLGLTAFATAATAGTWWPAAKWTISHVKSLTKLTLNIATGAFVVLSQIGDFTYSISNSLISMLKLIEKGSVKDSEKGSLRNLFDKLKKRINESVKSQNFLQLINPFRIIIKIIELPFTAIYFVAHLICVGMISDRFAKVPPKITAILNGVSEGQENLHFFTPNDPKDTQPEQQHKNLFDVLLIVALSPLKLLSAVWDWSAAKLTKTTSTTSDAVKPQQLTFSEVLRKAFGLKTHKPTQLFDLSNSTDREIIKQVITKEITRLESIAPKKMDPFNKMLEAINTISNSTTTTTNTISNPTTTTAVSKIKQINSTVLNEHRYWWWSGGKPGSHETFKAIIDNLAEPKTSESPTVPTVPK